MAKWNLKNKVIIITGATGGLGRALSETLHKKGAKLVLMDLDKQQVEEMAAKYGTTNAAGYVADVRKMDQLVAATNAAAEKFGHIDVVIAGAGIELFYPSLDTSEAGFERIIDINLTGIWRTFKAAFPYIKQSKGYFLTVSSMAAYAHVPFGSGYTASKAGNLAFTNSLRLEMEPFGVSVGSVHPSWFDTPMVQGVKKRKAWAILMNDDKSLLARQTPLTTVRDRIVTAIEYREEMVVIPWHLKGLAMVAPMARPVLRWFGPGTDGLRRAYEEFLREPVKL